MGLPPSPAGRDPQEGALCRCGEVAPGEHSLPGPGSGPDAWQSPKPPAGCALKKKKLSLEESTVSLTCLAGHSCKVSAFWEDQTRTTCPDG